MLWRDAKFFNHTFAIHHGVGHGVDQRDVFAHQLRHVFVAGGNQHFLLLAARLHGECADHIVGFHAIHNQQWQTHGANHSVQGRNLCAQIVGHRRTIGFVISVQGVAKGVAFRIKHYGHRAVRILFAQAAQHVHHALHRTRGLPLAGGQRRQGVEGAVEVGGAVDEDAVCVIHSWSVLLTEWQHNTHRSHGWQCYACRINHLLCLFDVC